MEAIAKHNFARISPQKARLVADQIRGKICGSSARTSDFQQQKSG